MVARGRKSVRRSWPGVEDRDEFQCGSTGRTRLTAASPSATADSRTRVVINAVHARSGGGVTYLRNILPLLAQDGRLDLHLFLLEDQANIFHPVDERIRVHLFPVIKGNIAVMLWEQIAIPFLARRIGADVIFSPANFGCLLSSRNVILLRNALSVARVESRPSRWAYWTALGVATFLSTLRSRKVIAVSNYALRSLTFGFHRFLASRSAVIHHGVDGRFSPDPAITRENFILVVADLYVQKNLLNFIGAVDRMRRRKPDVRVRIVGSPIDPWYRDRVFAMVERLDLGGHVEFLGKRAPDELRDIYRRCLFMAFPSTAETFGNPLVEAMACGTPIACSNTTAMPEIVADAALLFDPFSPDSIAEACVRMIDSPDLRAALALKGLERAKLFSWRQAARLTADALRQADRGRAG